TRKRARRSTRTPEILRRITRARRRVGLPAEKAEKQGGCRLVEDREPLAGGRGRVRRTRPLEPPPQASPASAGAGAPRPSVPVRATATWGASCRDSPLPTASCGAARVPAELPGRSSARTLPRSRAEALSPPWREAGCEG